VEEGEPAEVLLSIAAREGCDIIVTGIARDETLGRMFLGNTVNRLVRGSPVPVLVVHDRAVRHYRDIVVGTDFSEASLQALLTT
ncbi:universal stress protein, partial [Listeria monocytogenes]